MIQQTSQNKPLSQFITMRNGSIDWEYTDQLIAQERSEAFKTAGRELVGLVAKNSLQALKMAGRVTLDVVDELVSSTQPSA